MERAEIECVYKVLFKSRRIRLLSQQKVPPTTYLETIIGTRTVSSSLEVHLSKYRAVVLSLREAASRL